MNSRQKGAIGVAQAIAYFTSQGYTVSVPVSEAQRYDLIVDMDNTLQRVEVKTSFHKALRGVSYRVHLKTCGGNQKTSYLDEKECDIVFVWCEDGSSYLFPTHVLEGRDNITLSKTWKEFKLT